MLLGISVALSGAPSAVLVFAEEKPIYWREAASGHSKSAYYVVCTARAGPGPPPGT